MERAIPLRPNDRNSTFEDAWLSNETIVSRPEDNGFTYLRPVSKNGASSTKTPVTIPVENLRLFVPSNDLGLYQGIVDLNRFPDLCRAKKYALASLFLNTKPDSARFRVGHLAAVIRSIYVWCLRQGLYSLTDFSHEHAQRLRSECIATGSMLALGGYADAVRGLLRAALQDVEFAQSLVPNPVNRKIDWPLARNVMGDSVNVNSVTAKAKELLVRCARSEISDSERKKIVKAIDEIHVYRQEPLSENTFRRHLENINLLARLPDEAKGLRFRPFESPNKLASTVGRVSRKTKDITIEQSVEIIEYVISMVFTVAPKIIAALEANSVSRQAYDQMSDQSRAKLLRDVVLQVESLPYGIKLLETATATQSIAAREVTLHTLYLAALECIFVLVQICNGRRKNEIRGERGIEAGLYRGCVQTIDDDLNGFELDVYILKYNTGWRSLPANRLVHDATKIAEQLQSAYFGLSGMKPEDFGLEYGSRRASLSIIASSFMGDVRNEKTMLFRHDRITGFMESCLPTCDAGILSKTHVYRRLFSNLYYHRFEDSRLIALMQQLQHLDLEQTRHYISKDPHWTQADKRVSKHRPAELKIDDASSFDYHKHHIERIFDGKPVGGGYALLVATLTKRLLKTAEFAGYSQKEKARIVAEKQASRGFSPDPKGHGICWVGSSRHTRKAAHCFNSETGNTEKSDASPSICHGCINFLSTPGHLEYQTGLLKELESEAANFGLPDSIRQQQKQHYDDLREIIWFEQESFGSNDAAIAKKIGDMVAAGENDQD